MIKVQGFFFHKTTNFSISGTLIIISVVAIVLVAAIAIGLGVTYSQGESSKKPAQQEFVTVSTKTGQIQGKVKNVVRDDGQTEAVYTYRNIPYAQPPVDDLRWRPPVPVKRWDGVLKYRDEVVKCKQFKMKEIGTEDCLLLHIRQPASSANRTNNLPVLFWIHGGGLIQGYADWYYPDEQCSASLGMVTVSINYRLNMFGFLSLKENWLKENYYGNFGIQDMIVALQWVKQNIHSFGGDPEKVTILGESGGGAAVNSLIASPLAAGLFVKAISGSGYPVSIETDFNRANERYGATFKQDTNCTKTDSEDVMNCLRNLTSSMVVKNLPNRRRPLNAALNPWIFPFNERNDDYPIRVLDNHVIPQPLGMMTKLYVPQLKLLIGNTAQEAPPQQKTQTWEGVESFLKPRVESFKSGLLSTLIDLYNNTRDIDKSSPKQITPQFVYQTMTADVILSCQTNDIVGNLTLIPNMTVYRYMVSQPFSKNRDKNNHFAPSAHHGIDTDALFDVHRYFPDYVETASDRALTLNFRQVVKEFVHSEENNFHAKYHEKTIEFWNDQILRWDKPYHEQECNVLRDNGFLRRAWGQLN